jgi:FkbM family methyltransferase
MKQQQNSGGNFSRRDNPKVFTSDATLFLILRGLLSSTIRLAIFFIRKTPRRFRILTPSVFVHQFIYDKERKEFLHLQIRDLTDFSVVQQIYKSNDYATEKLKRNGELLEIYKSIEITGAIPLIVDCGGNIGVASRFFSEQYPSAKVICIEPDADNISQAKLNNYSSKIEFIEAAIGSESGKGKLVDPGLGSWGYRTEISSAGSLKIISVNELLAKYPEPQYVPFAIKIDVEGFESDLFAKNLEWIESFPLIIIELHDWMLPNQANSHNFFAAITPLKRDFVFHGENVFSIRNCNTISGFNTTSIAAT